MNPPPDRDPDPGAGPDVDGSALHAEFDTVAAWTAEVARDLGPDHHVPAGCRGSGSPGALRWLVDRLALRAQDRMLDCGAGVGGPAAFAGQEVGVRAVLSEPELGACRAARQLFGLPVVQAGSALPFASGSFDVAWSLGVLCTVPDQRALLAELTRVLAPDGRLGLLVFVARTDRLGEQPAGNDFPTRDRLAGELEAVGLRVVQSATTAEFSASPSWWDARAGRVEAELEARHGQDPRWQAAQASSATVGRLLARGELVGTLLVARRRER